MFLGFPIPIFGHDGALLAEVIASQSYGQTSATSGSRVVDVSYPTGTEPGDLVIALAAAMGSSAPTFSSQRFIAPPEGWAPIAPSGARVIEISNPGVVWCSSMRVAQPGDSIFSFIANAANRLNVSLVTIRGAALPLDAVSHGIRTSGGTHSGLTVVGEHALLLLLGAFGNSSSVTPSVTGPGTSTEILSYSQGGSNPGGLVTWMGYEQDLPSGATGSRVWTRNSESNVMALLSLVAGSTGAWNYNKQVYTSSGTYNFEVPSGVTSVNILCIGSGGCSYPGAPGFAGGSGGGGAFAYSNGVSVTPGETLHVNVGQSLAYGSQNTAACASYVSRSGTPLVLADYGKSTSSAVAGGAGGSGASSIGDVKGSGGNGNIIDGTGGSIGAFFSLPSTPTGSSGQGLSPSLSTVLSTTAGGRGAGARQHLSNAVTGGDGIVIITWGMNRAFGVAGAERII